MKDDIDGASRGAQHAGDLVVAEAFEISQDEDLGRFRTHLGQGLAYRLLDLTEALHFFRRCAFKKQLQSFAQILTSAFNAVSLTGL